MEEPTSKTTEKSVGGLTGVLYESVGIEGKYYETVIRDEDGSRYYGISGDKEEAEREASEKYNRR